MRRLLIIGCGDVAWRALPALLRRFRVYALLRDATQAERWRRAGAVPLLGDLDDRNSLRRLAGIADCVLHLAPPPDQGPADDRTKRLLAVLASGKSLPQRLVYISTSGVYGDCRGALVDETRTRRPRSSRGMRRADAEDRLRAFGRRHGIPVSLLRAPGIYAADRLPLERLRRGTPALCPEADVFTNHIHADDLAAACCAALFHGGANRSYNISDDSEMRMGDYFDLVADEFGLPRPPRLSHAEAERVLPVVQMSFMRESRRLVNRRMKRELRVRLRYPDVAAGVRAARQRQTQE